MDNYRLIRVEREGDVFRTQLRHKRLEEGEIQQFGEELHQLVLKDGCRQLALSLGPEPPDCLYSVFLAKLVGVRNLLARNEGRMVLCDVAPITYSVFEACLLHREFTFVPNFAAAVEHFGAGKKA